MTNKETKKETKGYNINRFSVSGHLSNDPVLLIDKDTITKVALTVASNNGNATNFIQGIAWNSLAKTIAIYYKKGDLVFIEGHIQTGSYVKDDNKVYTQELVIDLINK